MINYYLYIKLYVKIIYIILLLIYIPERRWQLSMSIHLYVKLQLIQPNKIEKKIDI